MKNWNLYKNEIKKYSIGKITTKEFAKTMNVLPRVARAFRQRYRQKGDAVFIHGNTNKKKPRLQFEETKERILNIFFNTLNKFNQNPFKQITYRYFKEILETYNIFVSESYLKKLLKSYNYLSPKSYKRKINEHTGSFRKEQKGELIQGDGSCFDWFGDGKKRCIHGWLDDATGEPLALYMTENECLLGYNESFFEMASSNGLPAALYVDGSRVFFSKDKKKKTQFSKSMEKLGVELIRAYSSEAKGKVERFWETIKLRLPVDFMLHNINTEKEANKYLKEKFIPKYVKRFGLKPKSEVSMFVPIDKEILSKTMQSCYTVKTDKNGIFSILGYIFICKELKNQRIKIYASHREGIYASPINRYKRYEITLAEGNSSGDMPQVMQNLINEFFTNDAKSPYKEIYCDIEADIA